MMYKKLMIFVLCWAVMLSAGLMIKPEEVFACSCAMAPSAEHQVEDSLQSKAAIFAGKATKVTQPRQKSIMSTSDLVEVNFEVTQVWKGEVHQRETVYTAMSSVSCGYEGFQAGKDYIVAANVNKETGQYTTTMCDLTKPLNPQGETMKFLGEGYSPTLISHEEMVQIEQENLRTQSKGKSMNVSIIAAISAVILIAGGTFVILRRRKSR
ncbi:MAG: hypothetical protein ACE3L7_06265 [Candidatus Pristimantibacillus sp.]